MPSGMISSTCDSPIEKRFLQGWMDNHLYARKCHIEPTAEQLAGRELSYKAWLSIDDPFVQYHIFTQRKIGKFRVDFYIIRMSPPEKSCSIVVECDGHDFHERTKEQAAKDRSRDRELTLAGYTVIRFTGSELYKDAAECARQAEEILTQQGRKR